MRSMDAVYQADLRRDLPPFRSGDAVRVHVKIREGEKERIQIFEGVVLRRRGAGASATFTVRKISYGVGVERIFPVESPSVAKVEIKSRGHVRRSRLYFLRDRRGKKARLRSKVRDLSGLISEEEADSQNAGTAIAAAEAEDAPAEEATAEGEAEASEEEAPAEEEAEASKEEAPAEDAGEESEEKS